MAFFVTFLAPTFCCTASRPFRTILPRPQRPCLLLDDPQTQTHQERDADAEGGGEVEERSRETKGTTDKGLGEPELETLT